MSESFFDHANISAEMAEDESAELRMELRNLYEGMIICKLVAWQYHETQIPLFRRLRKFHQISEYEIQHFIECQAEDKRTIERDIHQFRERWGAHPTNGKGRLLEVKPYGRS